MTHPVHILRVLIWFGSLSSVAIILTGNIDWRTAKKARDSESRRRRYSPGCTSHDRGVATKKNSHEEEGRRVVRVDRPLSLLVFLAGFTRTIELGDFIRRQVEVMQTRERFNGGFRSDAATVFSPSDELGTRSESNLCARSIRLIHSFSLFFFSLIYRESTFIHVLFVHSY